MIIAPFVRRRIDVGLLADFEKVLVCSFNSVDRERRSQVEAKPEVNGCSDYKGLFDRVGQPLAFTPPLQHTSEFQTPHWIGFPKIDARTQPIIVIFTGLEFFAIDQALPDLAIAAVIREDEGTRQAVQLSRWLIRGSELPLGGEQPFLLEEFARAFARVRALGADAFHSPQELFVFLLAHARNMLAFVVGVNGEKFVK
jgi:hypothetical protein